MALREGVELTCGTPAKMVNTGGFTLVEKQS